MWALPHSDRPMLLFDGSSRSVLESIVADWVADPSSQDHRSGLLNLAVENILFCLRFGKMQAWGRNGSPIADYVEIPVSAWPSIEPEDIDLRGSNVKHVFSGHLFCDVRVLLDSASYPWFATVGRLMAVAAASAKLAAKCAVSQVAAPTPTETLRQTAKRSRRRRPARVDVEIAMRQMSPEELADMKQVEMAIRFGASESTCRDKRKKILAENGGN
jgi:hypothetical protein